MSYFTTSDTLYNTHVLHSCKITLYGYKCNHIHLSLQALGAFDNKDTKTSGKHSPSVLIFSQRSQNSRLRVSYMPNADSGVCIRFISHYEQN